MPSGVTDDRARCLRPKSLCLFECLHDKENANQTDSCDRNIVRRCAGIARICTSGISPFVSVVLERRRRINQSGGCHHQQCDDHHGR
jgi:hypothetical protein